MSAIYINLADQFAWAASIRSSFSVCESFAAEYRYVPSLIIAGIFFTLIRFLRETSPSIRWIHAGTRLARLTPQPVSPECTNLRRYPTRLGLRLSRLVALLLVAAFLSEPSALAAPTPDAASAKQQIVARGVGKGVKVHEVDGTVLRGKIVSVGEDSFRLRAGSKPPVEVAFSSVRAVDGLGLSTGAKIGIAVGVGVVIVVAVVVANAAHGPSIHF